MGGSFRVLAQRWRQDLMDVGDQALMRGLNTAFPIMRPRLSRSYSGRRHEAGHKADDGRSPAVALPPALREEGDAADQAAMASLDIDQMKPTSSRAIAVHTTVVFLPRPTSER